MLKRKSILLLFMLCNSCAGIGNKTGLLCQSIYRSELSERTKTFLCGDGGGIKYRCTKVGECCEVGKDCEKVDKEKPKE